MGSHAIIRLRNFSYSNDWITWIMIGWKVTVISSNFIALMLILTCNEYSCYCKISSIKKRVPSTHER